MRPPPSKLALGLALAELRHQRGITQSALAAETGLHRTYIGGVESGNRNPTWETLSALCVGLGASLSDLARLAEALDADRSR